MEEPGTIVITDVFFSPAALSELHRVDIIASDHEDETGFVKDAITAYLSAEPKADFVPLEILGRQIICHCNVDGEKAYVSQIEVRN